jgi:organic radical activating enzyme
MHLRLAHNDKGKPEVFRSFQGEGRAMGRVRTFIRLSGCNLHCVWCDTAYTWNWVGSDFRHERDEPGRPYKFSPAAEMSKISVDDAAALVRALGESEGVVLTGGEPLMQSEALVALIDVLKRDQPGLKIEVETNGTISPSAELAQRVDLFMVSPKLAHSGNVAELALKPDKLAAFAALPSAYFKFVARTAEDIAVVATLAQTHNIPASRIYIMPEGVTSEALMARGQALLAPILAHGFNFTDRLHIHLFGAQRGV